MNRINQIVALVIGTLGSFGIAAVANADQSVCEKRILNRPGCEVGDFGHFGPYSSIYKDQIDDRPVVRDFREAPSADLRSIDLPSLMNPATRAQEHFRKGVERQLHSDLPAAIDQYQKSLLLDDSNPEVHHSLATALKALGREDEAKVHFAREQQLRKALKLKSDEDSKKTKAPIGDVTPKPDGKGF